MTDLSERLQVFRARFLERAAEDRQQLAEAWDAGDLPAVRRIAHGIAGNAGMFGFSELGAAARRVEDALDANVVEAELQRLIEDLLAQLSASRT